MCSQLLNLAGKPTAVVRTEEYFEREGAFIVGRHYSMTITIKFKVNTL